MNRLEQVKQTAARASMEPHALPELLYAVRTAIGGVMATVESYSVRTGRIEMMSTDRPDILVETREAFETHYSKINPRLDLTLSAPIGVITTDDAVGNDKQLMHHEFYTDFLAPSDIRYFCATKLIDNARHRALVAVHCSPAQGRVSNQQNQLVSEITPLLANCLALNLKMLELAPSATLADKFMLFGEPIAIISPNRTLLFANRAMRALFDNQELVICENGQLGPANDPAASALSHVMKEIENGAMSALAQMTGIHKNSRPVLRAVLLDTEHASEFSDNAQQRPVFLMIDDPSSVNLTHVMRAMEVFDLTRREADIGLLFANGLSVNEIAYLLNISRNTVRSHANMLRQKCGVTTTLAAAAELRAIWQVNKL